MTHRVSPGGSFRLDRRFPPPVGRLAIATGATTRTAFRNVVACIERLAERGRLDVLLALKNRQLAVAEVLHGDRTGTLDAQLERLAGSPAESLLWPAVEGWLGPAADRGPTVRRYGVSWTKLKRVGVLPRTARVAELADVDWKGLARRWDGSGSDWNHARRAVSRFLTEHLGDVYHELRRQVMKRFPKKPERQWIADLDLPTLWRVVEAAPEHVRPAYVALFALGLRVGEYLRLQETDLHPITKTVSVPGTKTAGSAATASVHPQLWPWVVAAVPAPVGYNWLRKHWKRALEAAGADPTIRLHDLRHLTAQVLVGRGQSEASVQTTMRHATASMTRRYAMQRDRGENAAVLADAWLGGGVPLPGPQSGLASGGGRG